MKFALSTNWCNRRLESGEEIADRAAELGFDGLELGFHTSDFQVAGFKARLDRMPVGSVHAFCPVPISAPRGNPELYQLASFDEETRRMAQIMVRRNIAFAAEMGATALVLHAGRVYRDSLAGWFLPGWFMKGRREKIREERGRKMIDVLKLELEQLVPELEKNNVKLGLENLPYPEGFPDFDEIASVTGDWVRPWLDTGHWYALETKRRLARKANEEEQAAPFPIPDAGYRPLGMHLNDSRGGDDHLAPGDGKIDFAVFRTMMETADHLVLEPNPTAPGHRLRESLVRLRRLCDGKTDEFRRDPVSETGASAPVKDTASDKA